MKFNDMVKSRRYGKSVKKNYELLDILPDTLDICGNTFELSRSSYMDDMGGGSSIYYSWDDYTFDFYGEEEYLILKLYKLEYDDDPEYPEAWNEELATVEEDLSHPWNTIEEMRGVMESMFNQYANKSICKMKKFNDSYMGFDDIFIREANGIEYLLHGEYMAPRERVEWYMEDEARSQFIGDEELPEGIVEEYIRQNHDTVVFYINMLVGEGDGLVLKCGVVYRSMLKGTINLYVCESEGNANEVAEILRGLEDAEDEADYIIASERIYDLTVDFIGRIRYDGEPEFEEIDIVNNDYIPDILW